MTSLLQDEGATAAVVAIERALLGAVITDNRCWQHTANVSVDDFLLTAHQKIYSTLIKLADDGSPLDPVTLLAALNGQGEAMGGPAYISSLLDGTVPENVAAYARHVRQAALQRRAARVFGTGAVCPHLARASGSRWTAC